MHLYYESIRTSFNRHIYGIFHVIFYILILLFRLLCEMYTCICMSLINLNLKPKRNSYILHIQECVSPQMMYMIYIFQFIYLSFDLLEITFSASVVVSNSCKPLHNFCLFFCFYLIQIINARKTFVWPHLKI